MTMLTRPKNFAKIVRDIVQNRMPLSFKPDDTVADMIKAMHEEGVTAAGVVDKKGTLIGFVTEREIVRHVFGNALNLQERLDDLAERKSMQELTAWDVMIVNPDRLSTEDRVEDAHDIILTYGYRAMPVVDRKGAYAGVVDERELHYHVHVKAEREIEAKNAMLSYFMHTEPYGIGAAV